MVSRVDFILFQFSCLCCDVFHRCSSF
jgi:hypothetical protein